MNSAVVLETLCQDVLYGLRTMRRNPLLTMIIVVTLALGIGATTAVFSIVDAVLLRPLPYRDASRLVVIWDQNIRDSGISKMFGSFHDFEEVATHGRSFDQVAAATWAIGGRLLTGHGAARELLVMPVSQSFFRMLGVAPAYGRTFVKDDMNLGCAVVLTDRLWRGPLGGDAGLEGMGSITLDNQACAVVGIMPAGFTFYPDAVQAWILLKPNFTPPLEKIPLGIFARLKPGVTDAQAQAEVSALHRALHQSDGKERDIVPVVYHLREEFTFLAEAGLRTTLLVLLTAVGLVLLIACLNVANLLLGLAFGRERELAVRAALGCGRTRLVRQLLTEGLLFGCCGGALGLGVAFSAVRYFRAMHPIEMPAGVHVEMSLAVLAFTAGISILTVLLFGLVPAWKASHADVIQGLKSAGRGMMRGSPHRVAQWMIGAEMALSLVLLAAAGLLMESVLKMGSEPLGFQAEKLSVVNVTLPAAAYPDAPRRLRFYESLASKLGSNAAFATALPPYGFGPSAPLRIAGRSVPEPAGVHDVGQQTVGPEYFRVMGVRLLRGRSFDSRDRPLSEPVAIINDALAREYFPDSDAIGKQICAGDLTQENPWRTVVGIIANDKRSPKYRQIGWVERGAALKPLAQDPPRAVSVIVTGKSADPRRSVADIDSAVAVGDVETMNARLGRFMAYPRFRAVLLSAFAVFALLLSAMGLYGVLGQFVAQRKQEIGVRMAVGARPADAVVLVASQNGGPVIGGLAVGLAGAVAMSRYLVSLLYGVSPVDPATLGVVSLGMLGVAILAAVFPALRAARVNPAVTLRDE